MVLIVFFAYVLIRCFFIEPNSLVIKKYEIEDNSLQGIRVAFLSDFHLKRREYKKLDKIVNMTNAQNPNVVLLGGDFARGHNIKDTMNPVITAQKLSLINAPTYAVLGENDWWTDGELIAQSLKDSGIRVLDNSAIRIVLKNRYVDIIGLADLTTQQPQISKAFRKTMQPRLVITHNPDIYFDIVNDVNLIFAGHTHGGQFIIPFAKPVYVPSKYGSEFASGVIKKSTNKMVVSRGIGTTGFPVRLNCKPEIIIVDFVRAGSVKYNVKKKRR